MGAEHREYHVRSLLVRALRSGGSAIFDQITFCHEMGGYDMTFKETHFLRSGTRAKKSTSLPKSEKC